MTRKRTPIVARLAALLAFLDAVLRRLGQATHAFPELARQPPAFPTNPIHARLSVANPAKTALRQPLKGWEG